MEDGLNYLDEKERQNTIDEVVSRQVGLSHLINFDGYDVCEQVRLSPLSKFHVTLLKAMCSHFELPHETREVKASLLNKTRNMVEECSTTPTPPNI